MAVWQTTHSDYVAKSCGGASVAALAVGDAVFVGLCTLAWLLKDDLAVG